MAKSELLRLRDVRVAFRLIGECSELGADPFEWRELLAEGLCRLTGAVCAIGGESVGKLPQPDVRILQLVLLGFDATTQRQFARYLAEEAQHKIDTPAMRFFKVHRSLTTGSHEQLITRDEWQRSEVFNEHFRPMHIDDRLMTFCKLPGVDPGNVEHGVTLLRALGDGSFSARDRRLVHLVLSELRPLVGTKLATCRGQELRALSPRLEQVRDLLLAGCSDQEIADECRLAKSTVREYVTSIYHRYGVSSRARLLSYFLRWRADGRK